MDRRRRSTRRVYNYVGDGNPFMRLARHPDNDNPIIVFDRLNSINIGTRYVPAGYVFVTERTIYTVAFVERTDYSPKVGRWGGEEGKNDNCTDAQAVSKTTARLTRTR